METLTIPEGSILKGTLDVVENEGSIQMASALVPNRMCSRQGDVTYHAKSTMARCEEISAPNGRLTLTAASLTATTLSANHIDITAGECFFEHVSAQGSLLIQADEIMVTRVTAGEVTLNGDMVKMESLVVEGTLTLRANLSMIHEIRAGKVIIQGSIDCKHLVASEGVFVESGSVAIKRLETPIFRAVEEVSGIVAVATTRDVRAPGVRGFLHPDELGMLSETPLPPAPAGLEGATKAATDRQPTDSATNATTPEIAPPPIAEVEDRPSAIPPQSEEEAPVENAYEQQEPGDSTDEGDSWGDIPGPKDFPTGSYGTVIPEKHTWGDVPAPIPSDELEASGENWPDLAPAKAADTEAPSFDWESAETAVPADDEPTGGVTSWESEAQNDSPASWEDDAPQDDAPSPWETPADEDPADDSALASWEDDAPQDEAPSPWETPADEDPADDSALSSWEDDAPQDDAPSPWETPADEDPADDSALASWEDDAPQDDAPSPWETPADEAPEDDSVLSNWDDEPAEDAPSPLGTLSNEPPEEELALSNWDDEPAEDAPSPLETLAAPEEELALSNWDDEPAEDAPSNWEDDAADDLPADWEEETPAVIAWDGSESPLAAFESYETRDVGDNWEGPTPPSGEFDTVALDPQALQILDTFAAHAVSDPSFEPSAEAFASDEDPEAYETFASAASDVTLEDEEDSLSTFGEEPLPEGSPDLEDDMADLAAFSPDDLELPDADQDPSFDYHLEPLNEETFDDVVELAPAQADEPEEEDPITGFSDDNFPDTSFDSIDPMDVSSFDDTDVPTLPEEAFEEIPLADSELPYFGDSEDLGDDPPPSSWTEVNDDIDAADDGTENEDPEFNLIKTSELPDLVVPAFSSDYTPDDLGSDSEVEELSPDDLGDLSQSFNDPDDDYLGAPSGEYASADSDDEDPLDVQVGEDEGDDADPNFYEDPAAEVEDEDDMASLLPEPVEELDPEEATVRDLSLIMEQIRQYFPEDNYPQFINQILRYLEERRISLFFKESNKNAVLSNFDKFNSEEVSRLARSFFERVDRYRHENA